MKQLQLLSLFLLCYLTGYSVGGCGTAISIKQEAPNMHVMYYWTDTIYTELSPTDSTNVFNVSVIDGDCDVTDIHWFKNGNAIPGDAQFTAVGPGVYRVTYGTDGPQTHGYDVTIIVTLTITGIPELPNPIAPDFKLFPNPSTTGMFTIQREPGAPALIKIYDLYGVLIKETQLIHTQALVAVSEFKKGMYIIELTTTDGLKRRKKVVFN